MGRTHDALKRAEEQHRKHLLRTSREPIPKGVANTLDQTSARKYMDSYGDLKNNLLTLDSDGSIKRVLFINTFNEGESSDHAIRFAASLTEDSNLKVLIVDLNLWTLSLQEVFTIDHTLGLFDLFSQNGKKTSPIKKVGPRNLYSVRLGGDHSRLVDLFKSDEFDQFLKYMYERFDYLILDTPGGASFQECRILCSKVDAVVLVLKSDTTAGEIALSAKRYIENPSDKLLGVVINKTKNYHRKFVKVASMVVAISLIFSFGLFIGNLRLKPSDTGSGHNDKVAIPNINIDPTMSEKSADLAQPEYHAKAKTDFDDAFNDVPKEKIDTETKAVGEQIHESPKTVALSMETKKEEPTMIPEAAQSVKEEFKTGQAQVNALHRKVGSDSSEAGQKTYDVEKASDIDSTKSVKSAVLAQPEYHAKAKTDYDDAFNDVPKKKIDTETKAVGEQIHESPKTVTLSMETKKEDPPMTREAAPDEKDKVKDRQSRIVVVKEGDNLYRIILRAYGTYNDEIVSLVLSENPEISSPKKIVVGRAIKLPEVN